MNNTEQKSPLRSKSSATTTNSTLRLEDIGPGSVTWKINGESLVVLGWGRAVLLQFAHPLIAAGVLQHTNFYRKAHGSEERFHNTLRSMLKLTFGSPEQAFKTVRRIDAIHSRVQGELGTTVGKYAAGTPYTAHDPDLLKWVQCTLTDSSILLYEKFVGPLTLDEKDRYVYETTAAGPGLGVPEGGLPNTYAELQEYMQAMLNSDTLAVGPDARELAGYLLTPGWTRDIILEAMPRSARRAVDSVWPKASLFNRPLEGWIDRMAYGLLPSHIQQGYGFDWTTRDSEQLEKSARRTRLIVPRLPALLHRWPESMNQQRQHLTDIR